MPVKIVFPVGSDAHFELHASIIEIAPAEYFRILIQPMNECAVSVIDDDVARSPVRLKPTTDQSGKIRYALPRCGR